MKSLKKVSKILKDRNIMNGRPLIFSMDNHMIEWNDKYSVNISLIDEQHKNLFEIINKAIIAKKHSKATNDVLMEF